MLGVVLDACVMCPCLLVTATVLVSKSGSAVHFTSNVNACKAPICNATFPCQEPCASSCPTRALPPPKVKPMPNNGLHTTTHLHLLPCQMTNANEPRYHFSAVQTRAVPCSTRKVRPRCLCRFLQASTCNCTCNNPVTSWTPASQSTKSKSVQCINIK